MENQQGGLAPLNDEEARLMMDIQKGTTILRNLVIFCSDLFAAVGEIERVLTTMLPATGEGAELALHMDTRMESAWEALKDLGAITDNYDVVVGDDELEGI